MLDVEPEPDEPLDAEDPFEDPFDDVEDDDDDEEVSLVEDDLFALDLLDPFDPFALARLSVR